MPHPVDRWLFACSECSRDDCARCVHLIRGEWCPHACWFLWSAETLTEFLEENR